MKLKKILLFFSCAGVALLASAEPQTSISSVISAYRSYKDVGGISISVPTVVEIPFADEFIERFDFAVFDTTSNLFEPHFFKQETLINELPLSVNTNPYTNTANRMNDNTTRTYADFPLPDNAEGSVQITLSSSSPITSSALTMLLGNNVALPSFVEIRAFVDGQSRIVVARRKMDQQTIRFPTTTSNRWIITFNFGQPLRVSELRLHQDNAIKTNARAVRFLAQPNHAYRVYFDPDRLAPVPVGEAGNFASATDVFLLPASLSQRNPNYIIADIDTDGVPDANDNCISVANA
ncbi:MAG: Thrombospondin 3-like protein, partial [Parcubacteria group bacterium Gr01-1014_70]